MTAKAADKPGKDVVYLDVDDDITTVVDKVEAANDKIVALVLPKRFTTLQSIVNMRLLKRSADSASKNLVLITSEAALLPLAGAASLHVAKNLQSKPEIPPSPVDSPPEKPAVPEDPDAEVESDSAKLDYHRSIGELAAVAAVTDPETIDLEDEDEPAEEKPKKAAKDKKLKVPNFERFRLLTVGAIAAAVLFVVFIIMAIFVWPKATITLQTEATPVGASFGLTADSSAKALDEQKGVIPASLQKSILTSTQTVQATGQQNNGEKASGSVTMSAQDCVPFNGTPSSVVAGTGINSNGLFYITQSAAQFSFDHAAGSCIYYSSGSVSIVAQSAGTKYNVSSANFSVPSRSDVSANGSASGGTDDVETVLSQADVNNAAAKISDDDKNKFVNDFKKQMEDGGYYIISSTLKAGDPKITSSPAVGEKADSAKVTITIPYSALVVQKTDLQKAVTDQLNQQIDKQKQKIGTDDVLKDVSVTVDSQKSPNVATLSISENTTAIPIIDVATIKALAAGKKVGDINAAVKDWPGVKNVDVKLSPFWVSKAPKSSGKIVVVLKQVKTTKPSGS